jgi:hypothetical protein
MGKLQSLSYSVLAVSGPFSHYRRRSIKADSHIPCRSHAVPLVFPCRFKDRFTHTMPFPCRSPAVLKTDSHIPCCSQAVPLPRLCRDPATTLPFSENALFYTGHCIWDWYASDNKLRGTRSGKTPTCRQHAVTMPPRFCHERAMNLPWPWEVAFRKAYSSHGRGTAWERHGMCESNTAALCKSNGKCTI